MEFKITKDNRKSAISLVNGKINNALEICGGKAESYAKAECPVDTGALRNSITHDVDDSKKVCYIGTNMEYGPYVEFGTGIHYQGGRRTSWAFEDSHGEWHMTNGQKAQPFLKPAVADHKDEYDSIIKSELGKL